MPQPRLLFIVDKTYVTPMRLIQFLALIALFSATYPYIRRWASWLVEFGSMLGRNSLIVFCVGSILSLAGQITRFVYRGDIVVDTVVVISGCRHHGVLPHGFRNGESRSDQEARRSRRRRPDGVVDRRRGLRRRHDAGGARRAGAAGDATPAPLFARVPGRIDRDRHRVAAAERRRRAAEAPDRAHPRDRQFGRPPPRRLHAPDRAYPQAGGQRRRRRDHQSRRVGRARRQRRTADQERSRDDQPRPRDLAGRHRRCARLRAARRIRRDRAVDHHLAEGASGRRRARRPAICRSRGAGRSTTTACASCCARSPPKSTS